jgi:hypothetical protein
MKRKSCVCSAMTRLTDAVVLVAWVAAMTVTVGLAVVWSFVRRAWCASINLPKNLCTAVTEGRSL